MIGSDVDMGVEQLDSICSTNRLALSNMDSLKEELSVEVAHINCVQVNDVKVCEACQDQILEKFAPYTTRTHYEYLCFLVEVDVCVQGHFDYQLRQKLKY